MGLALATFVHFWTGYSTLCPATTVIPWPRHDNFMRLSAMTHPSSFHWWSYVITSSGSTFCGFLPCFYGPLANYHIFWEVSGSSRITNFGIRHFLSDKSKYIFSFHNALNFTNMLHNLMPIILFFLYRIESASLNFKKLLL